MFIYNISIRCWSKHWSGSWNIFGFDESTSKRMWMFIFTCDHFLCTVVRIVYIFFSLLLAPDIFQLKQFFKIMKLWESPVLERVVLMLTSKLTFYHQEYFGSLNPHCLPCDIKKAFGSKGHGNDFGWIFFLFSLFTMLK